MNRLILVGASVVLVVSGCSSDDASTSVTSSPAEVTAPETAASAVPTTPEATQDVAPTATDFDRSLPVGDEPEVLGPIGETEAEFETDNGLVQIGAAEVPDGVSASFPVPDDLVVQIASQSGSQSGFSGVSEISFADLVEFYEAELPGAGYSSERSQFVDGVVAVIDFTGPEGTGQVAISSAPGGGRSVLVTFVS